MDEHQQQTQLTCEARPGNRTLGQGGERHLPCSSLLFCTGRLENVQRLKLHVQSYYPAAHLIFCSATTRCLGYRRDFQFWKENRTPDRRSQRLIRLSFIKITWLKTGSWCKGLFSKVKFNSWKQSLNTRPFQGSFLLRMCISVRVT